MTVKAIGDYEFESADHKKNYNGNQINYVSWDHHLMFSSAFLIFVSPETTFRELIEGHVVGLIQADPVADQVVWSDVKWKKSNQDWQPDFDKSLADNGVDHKEQIRMVTEGLPALGSGE